MICAGVPEAPAGGIIRKKAAISIRTGSKAPNFLNISTLPIALRRVICSAFEDTFSHPIHLTPVFLVLSHVATKTKINNYKQRYQILLFFLFPRFSILPENIFSCQDL
jgi:putative effector of murein hydrolase